MEHFVLTGRVGLTTHDVLQTIVTTGVIRHLPRIMTMVLRLHPSVMLSHFDSLMRADVQVSRQNDSRVTRDVSHTCMSLKLSEPESAAQASGIAPGLGPVCAAVVADADRRAHPRLSARELRWLRAARLKYGPPVRLIDLSVGGALLESDAPLRPGSTLALELAGAGPVGSSPVVVPLRVVRCQLTGLG